MWRILYIQERWCKRMKQDEIAQTSADSDEGVSTPKAKSRLELDKK